MSTKGTQERDNAANVPLLATKLFRPNVHSDFLHRNHLIEFLGHNQPRPLTLISAPAGYGKSVLASLWLQSSGHTHGWVSLDETDNDLTTFLGYLLLAVEKTFPGVRLDSRTLLEASTLPRISVLARYLLNDLDRLDEPFILVLDDIHRIHEQTIFTFLEELLKYPPQTLHLVLVGRWDPPLPLASLRAYGRVSEIRASDLRFSTEETAHLLGKMLARDIDEEAAAAWTEQTEGWVAALRLVALSLRHRGAHDDLSVHFSGDSRYLQEYLLAEVLAHVPPSYQEWLLKTSLLDRFCAPLCEAVCRGDGADLNGVAFIEWLAAANLFLIELDDAHRWFRFHHLFQEQLQNLLEQQLDAKEINALNARASHWFEENGWFDEAIRYALKGGDAELAVALFAGQRHQLMNNEEWNRLERWLRLFPDEVVAGNAVLMSTIAFIAVVRGDDAGILPARESAQRLLAKLPAASASARSVRGEIAAIDSVIGIILGEAAQMRTKAQEALTLLPPEALYVRSVAIATLAASYQLDGDIERCLNSLNQAFAVPEWPPSTRSRLQFYISLTCFMEGDLSCVAQAAHASLALARQQRVWDTVSQLQYFLGIVYYLRNQLAAAEPYLQSLVDAPALAAPSYLAHGACALSRAYRSQGRTDEASEVLQGVNSFLREAENSFVLEIMRAFQVELFLDDGDLDAAQHLAQTVDFELRPPLWFHYMPQLTPIRLTLVEGTPSALERASGRLERMDQQLLRVNRTSARIGVLALKAQVHAAAADSEQALDTLAEALALAQPGGFIRNFVDLGPPLADLLQQLRESEAQKQAGARQSTLLSYIDEILAAFAVSESTTAADSSALVDPLTPRELETLRYLATELKPVEIAKEMYIAVVTVRSHTKSIYSKLGANSRFEAVQRARELDLL